MHAKWGTSDRLPSDRKVFGGSSKVCSAPERVPYCSAIALVALAVIVGLANEGLAMVAGDVVPDDSIVIEVVQHGEAVLVALGVVRLRVALLAGA